MNTAEIERLASEGNPFREVVGAINRAVEALRPVFDRMAKAHDQNYLVDN